MSLTAIMFVNRSGARGEIHGLRVGPADQMFMDRVKALLGLGGGGRVQG
jgi:hypothetical protein